MDVLFDFLYIMGSISTLSDLSQMKPYYRAPAHYIGRRVSDVDNNCGMLCTKAYDQPCLNVSNSKI